MEIAFAGDRRRVARSSAAMRPFSAPADAENGRGRGVVRSTVHAACGDA
jgi:hypothetical protein